MSELHGRTSTDLTKRLFGEEYYADFPMCDFPENATVLDVGCGSGRYLRELSSRGVRAIGIEPNAERFEASKNAGFTVVRAGAEHLPFDDGFADVVLCSVALPYTDEPKAVAEWARVLKAGGEVRASYHGFGYALWLISRGPGLRRRLFGAKMIAQTWLYWLTGKTFFGDRSFCQTTNRMKTYYAKTGFTLLEIDEGRPFWGWPVVIFHHLRKSPAA
ncbi:MAG: class I SAM-dependent methyltransferase [Candidatus Baltobacteraceae bacterium]